MTYNVNSIFTPTDLQFAPGLHGVQFTEPFVALKNPAAHCLQEVDAIFDVNEPGLHNLQDADPFPLLYEPAQTSATVHLCMMLTIPSGYV